MEKIDIFDKYLKNQMTADEKQTFDKDLAENTALNEEFAKYKLAVELLKFENLKKEIGVVHQEFKQPQAKVIKFPVMRIAAAVMFGILGFGGFWMSSNTGNDVLETNTLLYIQPISRGDVEVKKQAELFYVNGELDQLITLFKSSEKPNEKLSFLAAMAFYRQEKFQETLTLIEKIQAEKPTEFNNELEYYKGQSLVGLNRIDEALAVFEKMDKSNPYSESITWTYLLKLKLLSLKN